MKVYPVPEHIKNEKRKKFEVPTYLSVDGIDYHLYDGEFGFNENHSRIEKKRAKLYLKGLRKLWRFCQKPSTSEAMAAPITGNYITIQERYDKIFRCFDQDQIIAIGEGKTFETTSYVDGSFTGYVK